MKNKYRVIVTDGAMSAVTYECEDIAMNDYSKELYILQNAVDISNNKEKFKTVTVPKRLAIVEELMPNEKA